ncbi:hypothetical protein FKG94_01910 [Exilibacterium tricleocarpae]|uniref:Cupin domain-containing protein n=1 Tax=Exilibacterium tricleocarpae TaxID=2591008 RepID=A0A545U828_9GAMM|nr:hypothetical protein [Exilibacterium tricleocarpae]TQV85627.1 hypothetical protein FKG94_01910 [Exilibacterium tricleocarpae]
MIVANTKIDVVNPNENLVQILRDGSMDTLSRSEEVWKNADAYDRSHLVGCLQAKKPEDLHEASWEMHPDGDELLYLVSGSTKIYFDLPGGDHEVFLASESFCVVPQAVWHRFQWLMPVTLLFVTPVVGTQMKPYTAP